MIFVILDQFLLHKRNIDAISVNDALQIAKNTYRIRAPIVDLYKSEKGPLILHNMRLLADRISPEGANNGRPRHSYQRNH